MKTHILFVIDESGSMGTKRSDVISGYNTFLADQKKLPDEAVLTLVKFNTDKSVVHASVPIGDAPELSESTYSPGGNTALYDAISEAVRRGDDNPCDRVLCVVMTDGQEHSSRETTLDQVTAAIKEREGRGTWTFTYLGVDPAQWARQTGVSAMNTMSYDPNKIGAQMATLSAATATLRSSEVKTSRSFYDTSDDLDKVTK